MTDDTKPSNVVPFPQPTNPPHPADSLSFMRRRHPAGTGIDYWVVEPTGSYSGDCELGQSLANEYLAFIGQHPTNGNAILLQCIVGDMVDNNTTKGLRVGFLQRVNEFALCKAHEVMRSKRVEPAE